MKTSAYSESDYECEEEPPRSELIVTKVEILRADRCEVSDDGDDADPGDARDDCVDSVDRQLNDIVLPSEDDVTKSDWKNSQASLASSEISVHRESWRDIVSPAVEAGEPERWKDSQASLASSEVSARGARECLEERWSDTLASPPSSDVSAAREPRELWSDCRSPPDDVDATDSAVAQEPSEIYYTASSDVSLLSDTELQDKKGDKKECVIAGHVAAMRERFESMTRANTPCPDLVRSSSPSLDVFRNITPSPDRLG